MKVVSKDWVQNLVKEKVSDSIFDLIQMQSDAFKKHYFNQVESPSILHQHFENPLGELHLKCGSFRESDFFILKLATGFFENKKMGLPTGDGCLIALSKKTGKLEYLIQDGGILTDLRTAIAGLLTSLLCVSSEVNEIAIIGAGIQAYWNIYLHSKIYPHAKFKLYSRSRNSFDQLLQRLHVTDQDINCHYNSSVGEAVKHADIVITATPSKEFFLYEKDLKRSTHVIAIGSDDGSKSEVSPCVFKAAKKILVDDLEQTKKFGDLRFIFQDPSFDAKNIISLGEDLSHPLKQHVGSLSIADLIGIPAQDIAMAEWVINELTKIAD